MISTYNALSEEYYFFLSLYILSLLFDVMFVAMPDFRPISVLAFHSCGISRSIPSRSNDTRFQQKHQKYPKINSQNSSKISSKSIVLTILEVRNLKPFSTESSVDKSHCIKSGRWRTIPQAFSARNHRFFPQGWCGDEPRLTLHHIAPISTESQTMQLSAASMKI